MGRPKKIKPQEDIFITELPEPVKLSPSQIKDSILELLNKSKFEITCLELKINSIEKAEYARRIGDLKDYIKEMKGLADNL